MTTATATATGRVRIECSCATCASNAAMIGKSVPLAATLPSALYTACRAHTKKGSHSLVYMAHNPSTPDKVSARQIGLVAL